jgi:hypothetical protein
MGPRGPTADRDVFGGLEPGGLSVVTLVRKRALASVHPCFVLRVRRQNVPVGKWKGGVYSVVRVLCTSTPYFSENFDTVLL